MHSAWCIEHGVKAFTLCPLLYALCALLYATLILLLRQFLLRFFHPLHHRPVRRANEGAGTALKAVHEIIVLGILVVSLFDEQPYQRRLKHHGARVYAPAAADAGSVGFDAYFGFGKHQYSRRALDH